MSVMSANSNNLISGTCHSNYMSNKIYYTMEWFGFADYIMIGSPKSSALNSGTLT